MNVNVKPSPEPEQIPDSAAQFVVRAAQPSLRRFDNPFFALEMQLMARRTRKKSEISGADGYVLWALGLIAFFFACAVLAKFAGDIESSNFFGKAVAFFHFVFCGYVASWAAQRIFQREHIAGTLLDTILLPFAPLQWIVMKSVLTWHVLVLAWLSALPLDIILYALGGVSFATFFLAIFLPLWIGLVVWAYTLLLAPDYICDPPRPAPQGENSQSRPVWQKKTFALRAADLGRFALAYAFGFISFFLWMRLVFYTPQTFDWLFSLRYFYNMAAPPVLFFLTLNIGLFATAITYSAAMLSPAHEARRQAAAVCWCSVASIYYTGLGFFWPLQPDAPYWAAVIAPPFVVLIISRLSERWLPSPQEREQEIETDSETEAREKPRGRRRLKLFPDGWSRREIDALARVYSNPIFVKDLRVQLRGSSLFSHLFGAIVSALIFVWLLNRFGIGTGSNWWIWLAGYFAFPAMRAVNMWQQEARGVTLTMMLLSPLASQEMIHGRILANLLIGFVWPLIGMGLIAWIGIRFNFASTMALWPALFSMLAVPIVHVAFDAASVPGEDMEHTQVAYSGSGGCLSQLLLIPSVLLAWLCATLPVWLQWTFSLALVVIYVAITFSIIDEGAKKLDKRRLLIKPRKPVYRRY